MAPLDSRGNSGLLVQPNEDATERQKQIRTLAEDLLSFRFFRTWARHVSTLRERAALDPDDRQYLTEREQHVMNMGNYRNIGVGLAVGATTFCCVLGLSMWRRQGSKAFQHLWSSPQLSSSAAPPALPKSAQINLDRIAGKRKVGASSSAATAAKETNVSSTSSSSTATSASRPLIERPAIHSKHHHHRQGKRQSKESQSNKSNNNRNDDEPYRGPAWTTVWLQAEAMLAGGLAAVTGVAASFLMDTEKVNSDLERLPLEPGRSHLANRACPAMVQLYQQLILESSGGSRHWMDVPSKSTPLTEKNSRDPGIAAKDETSHGSWRDRLAFWRKKDANADDSSRSTSERKEAQDDNLLLVSLSAEEQDENERYREMFDLQQYQVYTLTHDQDPESLPTDQELWAQPHNRDLETMIRLVHNCQQRLQFMDDHREALLQHERDHPIADQSGDEEFLSRLMGKLPPTDTAPGPLVVPEPGVPSTYLGAVVTENEEEDAEQEDEVLQPIFPARATSNWKLVLY